MDNHKYKPQMYNSYKCKSTIVNVNEYSTITAKYISQMIEVDYPLYYNQVRVILKSESEETLNKQAKEFINYAKEKFSVVLVQSALLKSFIFTIYSRKNINYIYKTMKKFEEKLTNCEIYY